MTYVQNITNGQLDIPREIWEELKWPKNDLTVKVQPIRNGFKVQRADNAQAKKKKLTKKQWEKIFADMQKISKSGRQDVNLTEFIRHDRDTHF